MAGMGEKSQAHARLEGRGWFFRGSRAGASGARGVRRRRRDVGAANGSHHLVIHRGPVPGAGELVEDHPRGGHGEEVAQRRRGFALGGDVVAQLVLEGVLRHVHLLAVAVLRVAVAGPHL